MERHHQRSHHRRHSSGQRRRTLRCLWIHLRYGGNQEGRLGEGGGGGIKFGGGKGGKLAGTGGKLCSGSDTVFYADCAGGIILALIEGVGIGVNRMAAQQFKPGESFITQTRTCSCRCGLLVTGHCTSYSPWCKF